MADDHNIDSQVQDEEEEALSLSDLPITTDDERPAAADDEEEDMNPKTTTTTTFHTGSSISSNCGSSSSSSEPTTNDLFEFFSGLTTSEMSHAEDIIYRGKLKPFINTNTNIDHHDHQQQYYSLSSQTTHIYSHNDNNKNNIIIKPSINNRDEVVEDDKLQKSFHRRRSGSMSDLNIMSTSRSNSTKSTTRPHPLMRNSRSLDYRKLRTTSTSNSETLTSSHIQRNSSAKNCGGKSSEATAQKLSRPRWHILMFGLVKFPPEMDLKDMKNRQFRRNHPAAMFPSFEDTGSGQKAPMNRITTDHRQRKSSWGLLKVLSCKGNASVAVTASFGCMQPLPPPPPPAGGVTMKE
ncbi:uncharacterized protein C553.10 [Cornus florida]|uniref:uncharacterized protein C553.10 n=1 Tax=Cornus florida TaxID=4283 RepID=UPI0028978A40|nr:uncharacterized protein C553.10 [Cornus florida]